MSWSIVSNAQWSIPNGFQSPNGETVYPSPTYITIKTPNNTNISVMKLNGDWTSSTKTYLTNYWQGQYGNRLTLLSEATTMYNCHAYAWAESKEVWMNPPEQKKYFTSPDFSYEVTSW